MGDRLDESLITIFTPAKCQRGIPAGVRLNGMHQPFNSGKQVFGAGAQIIPIVHEKRFVYRSHIFAAGCGKGDILCLSSSPAMCAIVLNRSAKALKIADCKAEIPMIRLHRNKNCQKEAKK
jgi:hypothetical protein